MRIQPATVGRGRDAGDGGRRHRISQFSFDSRATVPDTTIEASWEESIQEQGRTSQAGVVGGLLEEYGRADGVRKVEDFRALGPAPWSSVAEHNTLLHQVRDAFTLGAYYPALVGAGALSERLLNQLVLTLRGDYDTHPRTSRRIRNRNTFNDWSHVIDVLHAWTVIDDATREHLVDLKEIRHASVHYTSAFAAGARDVALGAIGHVQAVVTSVFGTFHRPGVTTDGTPGTVVIRRDPS